MYTEWLAIEHYRLHLMEEWPEGARRDAGLAAARSALNSLEQTAPRNCSGFECAICSRRGADNVVSGKPLAVAA
jgi:hypothetical protein